jgi:FKBP-type peptidyl-prolyl cis-trans isomerase
MAAPGVNCVAKGEMGLADRLKDLRKTAQQTAVEHEDEIKQALQKAETTVDERTGGKYHDQMQKATAKADAVIEGLKQADGPPSSDEGTADRDGAQGSG